MKKTTKIITLILSAVLLIGAAIGISVSAEEATPTVSVAYKNVAYEGAVKVLYAVEASNVPEGAKVQMAFFDTMPASPDETPLYVKDEHSETILISGVEYKAFFSEGIAPKNMRKNIYAVPVITSGETIVAYGDPVEYSVYTYGINMLSKAPTEEQKALYSALLDYGASVQSLLLGTADYTEEDLAATGGYADQYCGVKVNTIVNDTTLTEGETVTYYRPGEAVEYTADLYKDGASFTGYTDENRKLVGVYGVDLDLKASEPGVSTITANYLTLEVDTMDKSGNYGGHNFVVGSTTYNYVTTEAEATTEESTEAVAAEATDASTNNVLRVDHPVSTKNGSLTYAYYTSGAAYIFETDVKWLGSTVDRSSDNWIMRWGFVSTGTNGLSNASKYLFCNYASAKLDSPLYINGSAGYTGTAPAASYATFPIGEWHRIRIEYVPLGNVSGTYTGIQRVYFDGELSYEAPVTATGDNSDVLTFTMAMRGDYDTMDWSIMYDNTAFYTVKEDYYGKGLYANDADVNKYDGENANHSNGTIVTEADGNNVLSLSKNDGDGYSVNFTADGIEYGETYVFDTDIKWVSMPYSGYQRNWFGRRGFVSEATKSKTGGDDTRYLHRNYFGGTPFNGMYLFTPSENTYGSGTLSKPVFTPGVWYNLRIEFTPTGMNDAGNYTGVEKTYINNVLVATENAAASLDNRGLYCYSLSFLAKSSMSFKVDNTFIGAIGTAKYVKDTNFEDGNVTQTLYATSTDTDAVASYEVVDNPVATDTKLATNKVLKANQTASTAGHEVNKLTISNSTGAQTKGVYVVEYDMLYESASLPKNATISQIVVQQSSGYMALFTLVHKGDGNVTITSDVDGSDPGKYGTFGTVKLLDGNWHTLRFVMYKNSTDSVYALYVDGELLGIGNYYHNVKACVTNQYKGSYVAHRIKAWNPADGTTESAAYYFDNMYFAYLGDIPEDIPDYDAD